jgi:hypothetical protein
LAQGVNPLAPMSDQRDIDTVVVDPADLAQGSVGASRTPVTPVAPVLARGTREQLPLMTASGERDSVEILRRWPHSLAPAVEPAPSVIDDRIVLARLALELYREIDQMPDSHGPCTDPRCAARISSLSGALIEACLLTQRILMMPETSRPEVDARMRELIALLER